MHPLSYLFSLTFLLSVSLQDAVFFSCGDSLSSKGMTYLTNSLFDYRSPENNGVRAEFILDAANHKVRMNLDSGLLAAVIPNNTEI